MTEIAEAPELAHAERLAEWLGETAPGVDTKTPFGRALGEYAQAAWRHDATAMRADYLRLLGLFNGAAAELRQ